MKKFLLSCFLALGITSSAQYNYMGDFETPGYTATIYKQFGGGTQAAAAACNGAFGGQLAISASVTQTGYMVDLSTIGQTGNGQKVDFTVSYKKGATVTGTLQLAYFVLDPVANSWSINYIGSPVTLTAAATTTCALLSGSLPAGTLQPSGTTYGIGAWFIRSGATSGSIYLDDINIVQDTSVTTAPACTTISNPVASSTINAGNLNLMWAAAPTAVNYKVTVGTTSGGSELFTGTVAGTSKNLSLAKNTVYYAKVVPSNGIGDATGCTEIMFTTDGVIAYCGGITASSTVYPISSVTLAGTTKTSSAATGTPAYEDFTSTVFNVNPGSAYSLAVIGTGVGTNRFGMTAFVDWNEDGDFADANEQFFTTAPLIGGTGTAVNLTGSITVPAGTTTGMKRMRVKYNFNSSTTALTTALSDPCGNMGNGQTEDYTLSVTPLSTAPNCTTVSAPVASSTNFPSNGTMMWAAEASASGYKVYIGTTSGGTDIANGVLVTSTSYPVSLTPLTMYYAKVVPTNAVGDATGCAEFSFTTAIYQYCTAGATSTSFEKIGNVNFAGINNPSTSTAGYEDFTAIKGEVNRGSMYPITVDITGFDTDETIVWIDYNQDGAFNEVTEKTVLSAAAAATGSINVPIGAMLGNTRMRVRMHYTASGGNATSCGTSTWGQVEDYTIEVKESLSTSNVNKSTVSVYPNPFQEVLKISDVKGVKSISVSDVSGRQVKNLKPAAELNLSDLKTGLYIVTLKMEDGTVKSFKAIKK